MSGAADTEASLQGLRILVVEDDPLISLDLEVSLSELGAVVTPASNVSVGLKIVAAAALDFAVLDFELGQETSEAIAYAVLARNVPFLFLSGYSQQDERFARWRGTDILVKPISPVTVARRIRQALARRQ